MENRKDIQLSVGTLKDVDPICQLGKSSFSAAFRNSLNGPEVDHYLMEIYDPVVVKTQLIDSLNTFIVGQIENELIGFARIIEQAPEGFAGKWLQVDRLYLEPHLTGQGIGTVFMHELIKRASFAKCTALWLAVLRTNVRAISFYKKFGLEEFGRSPGKFEADAEIDLWMKLELST